MESLADWLSWIERQHPKEIDLGLERVATVAQALELKHPRAKTLIVAGTNGKGSIVAAMEALALSHGTKVATFTSPHFLNYNERVRVNGESASDNDICAGFAKVKAAADSLNISLTYFEYSTLGALCVFERVSDLDLIVLEVGLGGRLDAVNIADRDLCVISSIGLDHQAWLGNTLDAIALEKAGIARSGVPMILAEKTIPKVVNEHCQNLGAEVRQIGQAYKVSEASDTWSFQSEHLSIDKLTKENRLKTTNLAAAIYAFSDLFPKTVDADVTRDCLNSLRVFGRFSKIFDAPEVWLDVAHNEPACRLLAERLSTMPRRGKLRAVVSMLNDKDAKVSYALFGDLVDTWYFAELDNPRAMSQDALAESLISFQATGFGSIEQAFHQAMSESTGDDTIIVFGSFFTVAAVYRYAIQHFNIDSESWKSVSNTA